MALAFTFTIDSTSNVDPVITASGLADGDVTWTKPSTATFTGKSPASGNFDETGAYSVAATDVSQITGLDANTDNMTIADVENLTSLTFLYMNGNSLVDVGDLSLLTNLTDINLTGNSITTIGDLSTSTSIVTLEVGDNSLTDVGDLSALTSLETLNVQINSLTTLVFAASVETLYCDNNSITDLAIPASSSLTVLECDNNTITALNPANATGLVTLVCDTNVITSLPGIASLTSLTSLACGDNAMTYPVVDSILADLITAGMSSGTVAIAGTNSPPSAAGMASRTTLLGNGVASVTVSSGSLFSNIVKARMKPHMHLHGIRKGHPLAPNIEAFYPHWDGDGDKLMDISGNGNHGTLVNSPTWQGGPSGDVLDFNGSTQYVDTGILLGTPETFSVWLKIKPEWVGGDDYLVDSTNGSKGFGVRHDSATNIDFFCFRSDGLSIDTSVASQDKEWVSILVVMETNRIVLYRNGIKVGEDTTSSTGSLLESASTIKLSADFAGGGNLKSQIDGCGIWENTVLTQADAQWLYEDPYSLIKPRSKTYIYAAAGFVPTRYYYNLLGATG